MRKGNSIVLMGMKHCGKSTLGTMVAERYACEFYDLDEAVEMLNGEPGVSVRDIYARYGKDVFQRLEAAAAQRIREKGGKSFVLALGGGTIENAQAMEHIRPMGRLIYLREKPEILFMRIEKNGIPPFLSKDDPFTDFLKLYERRAALYEGEADLVVDLNAKGIEEAFASLIAGIAKHESEE